MAGAAGAPLHRQPGRAGRTGTVTWNDDDLADLDPATVWRATAMVPQDYTRWPLAARENITLGRPRPQGDSAVHAAAERAGADTVRSTATRP